MNGINTDEGPVSLRAPDPLRGLLEKRNPTTVFARSEATWQSLKPEDFANTPQDCLLRRERSHANGVMAIS